MGNAILDQLPEPDLALLQPYLKLRAISRDDVLCEQGQSCNLVYLPISGLVSCLGASVEGQLIELYSAGRDGLIDVGILLNRTACLTTRVMVAGEAYEVSAENLWSAAQRSPSLALMLMQYTAAVLHQMVRGSVCGHFHPAPERLNLWLVATHLKLAAAVIPCTQDSIAQAVGVRRQTLNSMINALQRSGLVQVRPGQVTLIEIEKLRRRSCRCIERI